MSIAGYELNQTYNEDCLQAMKKMPDKYFELTIVDPPYGSGSSVIACHDLGFDYLGFEIDKYYFDLANERINKHKAQMSIFDLKAGSNSGY